MAMTQLSVESNIDPSFVASIRQLCDVEQLRSGRQIIRDSRGWKVRETTIQKLWVAEVEPTFMESSCLGMLTSDHGQMAFLCLRQGPTISTIGPIRGIQADPVEHALQSIDAWSARREVSIDGIAYGLFLDTHDLQLAMSFANPRTPSLVALERSLLQVASVLSQSDSSGATGKYLHDWARYAAVDYLSPKS